MSEVKLFIDGSVNPQNKIGVGAFLLVEDMSLAIDSHRNAVKVKKFENTSSTRLELETAIWALNTLSPAIKAVVLYTDSQNIAGLIKRRAKLEKNDFLSASNKRLNNHDLYREFYRMIDSLPVEIIQLKGHQKTSAKEDPDILFSLVDKASRKALREAMSSI